MIFPDAMIMTSQIPQDMSELDVWAGNDRNLSFRKWLAVKASEWNTYHNADVFCIGHVNLH